MILLVSDYDNTYELHYNKLNSDTIFQKNYNAIQDFMNNGNVFVIASGRHFDAMKTTIEDRKLKFDYLIANNGAEVYDKCYNLLYAMPIDEESLFKIQRLEKKVNIFYRNPYKSNLITSVNIYFDEERLYSDVKSFLETELRKCSIEYKFPKIKIINKFCNKVNGIKIIQETEKFNNQDIYTIGDDINDFEMIKQYNGYSLKKSNSAVKQISKKEYKFLFEMIDDLK